MKHEDKAQEMRALLGDDWEIMRGVGPDGEYLELVRGATTVSWLKDGDPMPYAARTRYGGLTWASGSAETPRAAVDAMIEDGKRTLAGMAEDLGAIVQSIRQMAGELGKVALPSAHLHDALGYFAEQVTPPASADTVVYETWPVVRIGSEEYVLRKNDQRPHRRTDRQMTTEFDRAAETTVTDESQEE